MKINAFGLVGYLIALIGAGMVGAAMGTSYWRTIGFANTGLFQSCISNSFCTAIGWTLGEQGFSITILVTRSVLFLSCLLIFIGIIAGTVALCTSSGIVTQGVLNIIGGCFILVACGGFTGLSSVLDLNPQGTFTIDSFGYSYFICWASGVILIIAGAFGVNGQKKQDQQIHPATQNAQLVWATTTYTDRGQVTSPGQHELAMIKT